MSDALEEMQRTETSAPESSDLALLDEIAGPFDENITQFSFVKAREAAWVEAVCLTNATTPEEVAAVNLYLHTQQLVLDTFREFDEAEEAARAMGAGGGEVTSAPTMPAPAFSLADGLRLAVVDRMLRGEVKVPLLPTVVSKVLEITRR